jgi:hypothetical protein
MAVRLAKQHIWHLCLSTGESDMRSDQSENHSGQSNLTPYYSSIGLTGRKKTYQSLNVSVEPLQIDSHYHRDYPYSLIIHTHIYSFPLL